MRYFGYILIILGAAPWLVVRLTHPDMTDTRIAITFWPLMLVTVIMAGVGSYLARRARP